MQPDGTARNLYISSPRDIVVSVYDSVTYIIRFFKVIANAFSILCVFLALMYVFYVYTINLSFPYFNTEVIYMSFTEHRFLSCALMPCSVFSGYTTPENMLISTENVEKYVMCVLCG
jgi:hypothetical protein